MYPCFFSFLTLTHFCKTSDNKVLVRRICYFAQWILKIKSIPYSMQPEYLAIQYEKCKVTSLQNHNFFTVIRQTYMYVWNLYLVLLVIFFWVLIFPHYFSLHGTRYCVIRELKDASLSYKFFVKMQDEFYHSISHRKFNCRHCINQHVVSSNQQPNYRRYLL